MSEWTKEEMEKTLLNLKKKAMKDATFRSLCIADAAAAVKEIAGKYLPDGMKLKFVENDGGHMTIVLPDMAAGPGLALGVDVLQINHQQQIMVGHGGLLLCFAPHQTAFSDSVYRTAPGIDKV